MSDDLRYQPKCYYASPEYAESFWGKFIYLYQGKGSLRLTEHSLCLEDCPQAFEIPFHTIKSISSSRFSSWAKPLGLSRLTVRYTQDGELKTIHLVPYESVFASTIDTSNLVASWLETLGHIDELTNRIDPPQFDQPPPHSFPKLIALAVVLALLIPLFIIFLIA